MPRDLEIGFGQKNEEGKIEKVGTVTIKVPETLEEAKAMWGEQVVLSKAISAVVIDAQRIARASEDVEKAQATLDSWVPGVAREKASGMSTTALAKKLRALSPEKLRELLAEAGVE